MRNGSFRPIADISELRNTRAMGAFVRICGVILLMVASAASGWWLHDLAQSKSDPVAVQRVAPSVGAPAVDADPQYFAQMTAHHQSNIPPTDLARLRKAALGGSNPAIEELVTAYEDCASMEAYMKRRPVCGTQLTFWLQIARENGAFVGANIAFNDLSESDRCEDVYRARYWLDKMLAKDPHTPWVEASRDLAAKEKSCA